MTTPAAWAREQAKKFGLAAAINVRMLMNLAPEDSFVQESLMTNARLAAHFGRLALRDTALGERVELDIEALEAESTRALLRGTVNGWVAGVRHGLSASIVSLEQRTCVADCPCRLEASGSAAVHGWQPIETAPKDDLDVIARRVRDLASCFTGTRMGHRLPKADKDSSRDLGVTFVDLATGEDKDVGEELLAIADEIDMLGLPKVVGRGEEPA